jgi:transcriptional regulator with XRE-family HTH domain
MPQESKTRWPIRRSFAATLKKWRRKNKIPLKQIAAHLRVSIATIHLWESGKRFPNGEHFEMLAEYTGQTPCRLFCLLFEQCPKDRCLLGQWDGSDGQSGLTRS